MGLQVSYVPISRHMDIIIIAFHIFQFENFVKVGNVIFGGTMAPPKKVLGTNLIKMVLKFMD
jgi:hypothetical protein